ncbi:MULTISPECIES: hypothetical protein [unclassified Lonepinella]|uniref:hypothetical protein n=1 Tax=unclassified Lonepinella TaxID=2642006 RepID=UPI0036DDC46A
MLKKLSLMLVLACLSACSSVTSYIPFMGSEKNVINLDKDQVDQKSYAVAYSATVQTYKGSVNEAYDVDSFTSGVNDWYLGRILVSIDQIKAKLASGIDSNVHAYYSGVVFAADLQSNFSRLSADCWTKIDRLSMTQGIYDAMRDLQKDRAKSENDEYLSKGSEELLSICR